MSGNSFGRYFRWTTFGESHGPAIGVVVEGCPSGLDFDAELLAKNLERRRPGQQTPEGDVLVSSRQEADGTHLMSGVFEGKTLGTPIALRIDNQDARSEDYRQIKTEPRIGHADDVWKIKYGHVDFRGGGRASARETAARVIAGSIAQMICRQLAPESRIFAYVEQIGHLQMSAPELMDLDDTKIENYPLRFPSPSQNQEAVSLIKLAKEQGESYGGIIGLRALGFPPGLGQPVFGKIKSDLAFAFMSINACVGVELGDGFRVATKKGSEWHRSQKNPGYGGIRGGLTTGEDITLRLAFKPTSSLGATAKQGRHDPCILPRAVPVAEAMAWCVFADHLLGQRLDRIRA